MTDQVGFDITFEGAKKLCQWLNKTWERTNEFIFKVEIIKNKEKKGDKRQ